MVDDAAPWHPGGPPARSTGSPQCPAPAISLIGRDDDLERLRPITGDIALLGKPVRMRAAVTKFLVGEAGAPAFPRLTLLLAVATAR